LARLSNPKRKFYSQKQLPIPKKNDFLPKEKATLTDKLIKETLDSFISTISPYRVLIEAEVSSGGEADVEDLLKNGNAEEAKKIIEAIPRDKRFAEDWYNLGLAYEASARSREDYEDAQRYYINALEIEPGEKLYAQGIGRCDRYLKETKNKFIKN